MENYAIQTYGLSRRFGQVVAVDQVDLRVPQGCVYGFLGPNGAGKTTTIRMLLGLVRPDTGKVALFGSPLHRERLDLLRRVGSLVEAPSLYPHLSGWENLEIIRRMTGKSRADIQRVLATVRLESDARRRVGHYSMGMRQRLALAMALMGQPELLILDEPTNGLDPAGIHEVRELLRKLPQQEGVTVFVSSHLLSEVEQVATHIGIIDRGKMIFQGTPDALRASYQDHVNLVTDQMKETVHALSHAGWSVSYSGNHHLTVKVNGLSDVAMLNTQLVFAGVRVYHLVLEQPSLEDIFLAVTEAHTVKEQA